MRKILKNKPIKAHFRPKWRLIGKVAIGIFIVGLIATPSLLQSQAGIGFSPILSGSMRPAVNVGDVLLTKVVKASTLRVGDIIIVHNQVGTFYYAHRIAEIRTANSVLIILTKGDSNPTIDQDPYVISPTGEISKEFFVVPLVGSLMTYITSFQGRQFSTILLVVANVLGVFFLLFRKKIINFAREIFYKDLYMDERATSDNYRNLIDHLKTIEMEKQLMKDEK